jgi:formate dehydrogenase alpha subunit
MTINIIIDGKKIKTREKLTILQAARENDTHIPTLCYHKDLSPTGNCRMCVVEVKGSRFLQAACVTQITEGMEIEINSKKAIASRKLSLGLMLANHTANCSYCDISNDCELQDLVYEYEVDAPAWGLKGTRYPVDSDPNPFIHVDFNKCILCRRCVLACAEIQVRDVWGVAYRGFGEQIVAGAGETMLEARCESCGQCVAYCPTGALSNKLNYGQGIARAHQIRKVTTTCTYCGVGCQFDLVIRRNKVIGVASNSEAAVNGMALCVKGRYGYDFIHHPDRLTRPRVRRYLLDGKKKPESRELSAEVSNSKNSTPSTSPGTNLWDWVETDWETALNITADKMRTIRDTKGPDSIGILTSAKCLNEENYLMNKLARQVIGTNNIDHCARLCHSSTVTGLAASYGSGAMSNSMDDIAEQAKAFFIIGSNITEQHPVFGTMIRRAVRFRGAKLIVADPRKIDITEFATLHLRQNPGTDIALLNGLMYIILEKGWEDKQFIKQRTEDFEEFKATIMQYTPEKASTITGIPVDQLYQAAEILNANKPCAVIWAMGITQHIVGVRNVIDLANLQMLLGNMGVPGGGVNPLRGQNNVQGACDMGGLPNVFPGYQSVTNAAVREKFARAWGLWKDKGDSKAVKDDFLHELPVDLSCKVGLTVTEMLPDILKDKIHALYILGEDPVMSDPDTPHIRKCLAAVDFFVLQEIFPSETSVYADVLLPGVSFAEKTGTFTNTERRVQMVRQAIAPLGEAHPDWWITSEIAKSILAGSSKWVVQEATYSGWDYHDTSEIMTEINALTPSYGGITHSRLENGERLQWPCPTSGHPGTAILHSGQFTRGKGKFAPIDHIPPAECPDEEYPLILSTGRVLYHWHGGEMTRRAKGLMKIYDEALVELNPYDAEKLGIDGKKTVRVTSRRGSIEAKAWVTDRVPPGMLFANFHFPEASANELTIAALDPEAKIPEYKVAAVKVELVN